VETNQDLIARFSRQFHLDPNLFIQASKRFLQDNVQAVATFTRRSTMNVSWILRRAWRGCDDWKTLATNMKQARAIESAAKKSGIQVIVIMKRAIIPETGRRIRWSRTGIKSATSAGSSS